MSRHRIYVAGDALSDDRFDLDGEEVQHAAKSKRVRVDDEIDAFDGAGLVCRCRVVSARKGSMSLEVVERTMVERIKPSVEMWTATPKGPRLDKMIDTLVQAGATSWRPMATKLGVVDPGANKIDRTRRISVEAAKQSGAAWLLEIGRKAEFDGALGGEGVGVVLADGSGGRYRATGAGRVRVLIGPEGGFVAEEIEAARGAGAQVVSLGPLVMRIETAAAVACAIVLDGEREELS